MAPSRTLAALAAALALVLAAAGSARAEYRSIPFRLGDRIQSVIEPVDDRDSFAFDGIEGTKITFKVSAAKGTDLVPALGLFGPDGRALDVSARLKAKKQKVQLKKYALPATGRFLLRVTSANGEGGAFTVTTKGKPPGSRSFKGVALAPGATQVFEIPAESDATLKVAVKGKGQGCEVVSVKDPAEAEIPGGVAAFDQMGPSKKAKATLLLAQGFGAYAITVGKAPEPTTLKVKLKVKFAKREAEVIEVPALEPNSAPIAKLQPITGDVHGAISFPFTLQDPEGDTVTVYYKYGIDLDGDGEIRTGTGEEWRDPTPIDGSAGTSLDTEPWDEPVAYTFVWDSVRDIGSPGRDSGWRDVVFRVYPRDADPGVADQITDFRIVLDPDGLYLLRWGPDGADTLRPGEVYAGEVELNRPLVFHFNAAVAAGTATKDTLRIHAGSRVVSGYYDVDGKTVTFYPQVQEVPPRGDVLQPETLYSVEIPGYDPTSPRTTLRCAGGSSVDYSGWLCLLTDEMEDAFTTGDGYVAETGKPTLTSLDVPTNLTGASVDTQVVLTLSEPMDPATFEYPGFQLVVSTANGNAVVPVSVTLRNVVGPPGVRKCVVTLTPKLPLPSSATVKVILSGAIEDFAGNSLVTTTRSFTTETGTPETFTTTESFTSTRNRDEDLTTAYWGTKISGRLTGLDVGGTGKDGALTVKSGTTTLSGNVYHFTTLTVEEGATLKFSTTKAVELLVQGDVTVKGTIDVSGEVGDDCSTREFYFLTKPPAAAFSNPGGRGGPGGGDGGSASASVPTESGKYIYQNGGHGAGSGGGGGATCTLMAGGAGGGGGGHARPGEAGGVQFSHYCSGSAGEGGQAYGAPRLASMMGGSGGGAGSGSCYYGFNSDSNWYYYVRVGAGGGGGGGSIKIATSQRIVVASTGAILARGGDGGQGYMTGGGGGGGSGGDIALKAARGVVKVGRVDATGGVGGTDQESSYGCFSRGGDGSGGRLRLEEPDPPHLAVLTAEGDFATAVNKGITGGGLLAGTDGKLAPTKNLTLTTSSLKSTWYFTEIDVPSGVTLTIEGDRPARLVARDRITISGDIRADGAQGDDGAYMGSEGFTSVQGGKAGPGGWRGGRSHTKNGKVPAPEDAEDGQGPGGGKGGTKGGPYVSGSKTYYYYPGAGGGSSHGTDGEDAYVPASVLENYSHYKPGQPGEGGATYGSTASLTHLNIQGGSGGGGGANRMLVASPTEYHQGGSGGGGGGAVVLETPGTLRLAGRICVGGGDGGRHKGSGRGGGGGSGGAVLLRAGRYDIPLGVIDSSGGKRGGSRGTGTYWARGGSGGKGRIKLEATSSFEVTLVSNLKGGSYSWGVIGASTGLSVWFDTGSLSPTYKSLTSTVFPSDGSQTKVWLEVCHTDPQTLGPNEATLSKLTDAEVTSGKANGYRFYRFRMKLEPGEKDPYVDEVKVTGSIVKKSG